MYRYRVSVTALNLLEDRMKTKIRMIIASVPYTVLANLRVQYRCGSPHPFQGEGSERFWKASYLITHVV